MFELFHQSFIQNAFLAGTCVAILAGGVGYFLLLRKLTFAGHALSHIGFAGATGAVLIGADPLFGLLLFTLCAAGGISFFGKHIQEKDVTIGVIMTFMLGLGVFFLSLYTGYAERAYSILFGTILGITRSDVFFTALFSLLTFLFLLFLFRPLLFSSFDSDVAEARGVPVHFLDMLFLLLVAVTISLSVQVVGVLLVFTLLVGPAATAVRLTQQPFTTFFTSLFLAVIYTWISIFLAMNSTIPVSFYIAALSFFIYIVVRLQTRIQKNHV